MKKKKINCTLLVILIIALFCHKANGQHVANDSSKIPITKQMSELELSYYRQSIWDSLPGAVGWVNDFAGLFKNEEENDLESIIAHFEKKTSIEIMIVTVDTNMVSKNKFKDFSDRLLKVWGIGKASRRNGIVISICSGYHETKISTDFGIDKFISEPGMLHILKKYFIPYYQKNKFYAGTLNGLNALIKELSRKIFDYD